MRRNKKTSDFKMYDGDIESLRFKPLIFIDFEYITTSYRQNGHKKYIQEIIEIACIVIKEDGYVKFNNIIKPKLYLNQSKQTGLSKLTIEDLDKGIDLHKAISFFKEYYKPGVTKVLSWGNCDLYNINNLCRIYGIQFHIRQDDYVDLSQRFRRFYGLTQAITLEKALSLKNIKDDYKKHRALPDTEMLLRLFNTMVEEGYLDTELIKGE